MGRPAAVRIELRQNNFSIEQLIPERFKLYGFGSFLENVKMGEVSMNKAAFDYLAQCPERRGLMGIEIFPGPVVAYGAPNYKLVGVPKEEVSVQSGTWKVLEKLIRVTE